MHVAKGHPVGRATGACASFYLLSAVPAGGMEGSHPMAARAGEKARETGTFVCQSCNEKVRVQKGHTIPKSPNGHVTYDERIDEPRDERR